MLRSVHMPSRRPGVALIAGALALSLAAPGGVASARDEPLRAGAAAVRAVEALAAEAPALGGPVRTMATPPAGYLVWDSHDDAIGDGWNDALAGPALMEPELVGSLMAVPASDPTTAYDDSAALLVMAGTSSPTDPNDWAVLTLDTNGDGKDDLISYSPAAPAIGARSETAIFGVSGTTETPTGKWALWQRNDDSYVVGLDWKALGLTKARVDVLLSDADDNYDWAPDDYEGASVVLPRVTSAPRSVTAVAGDARATVRWAAPATPGSSGITGYLVTAVPGGRTCRTTGLSCIVYGLTNQTRYTFRVTAINQAGSSPQASSAAAVVPQPYVGIIMKPRRSGNVLFVDLNPNKGRGYWTFRVLKRDPAGKWVLQGRTYKTKGSKETRTINVKKGTYRIVVLAKDGYQQTISPLPGVTLRK